MGAMVALPRGRGSWNYWRQAGGKAVTQIPPSLIPH